MRLKQAFLTLCILALLVGSGPTTQRQTMRAALPPTRRAPVALAANPLAAGLPAARSDAGVGGASTPQVAQSSAIGDWHIQTVDSEGDVGKYASMVLDTAGHPHIGYSDGTNGDLKYARWMGSAWDVQVVDSEGDASYASLALDAAGNPHISYQSSEYLHLYLKYAHWTGGGWDIQIKDMVGQTGWFSSLALDGAGNPHISYLYSDGHGDAHLKYVYWTGTAWSGETLDYEASFTYTSLAVDGAGRSHISYEGSDGGLKYAHWTGSAWDIQTVGEGYSPSLALDAVDRPHISYLDDTDYILKYARWTSDTWDIQPVDTVAEDPLELSPYHETSLALDGAGRPHISYYDGTNGDLKYAHWTGGGWDIQTVDAVDGEGEVGEFSSLVVDAAGAPHIGYYSGYPTYDLKYAWLPLSPSPTLDKVATPDDGLCVGDTLTYTLSLSGPVASARLWDSLPTSVEYVTGSVTSTLSPPAVYSPTAHAILWQGALPTDTVHIHFQVTPTISQTGSVSLSIPIVNTAWLTETEYGRSVSATSRVNGWRVYLPHVMRGYPYPSFDTVLWMHLDESAGATAFSDSSAHRNHGACSGTSCPVAGGDGSANTALYFDGVDDYVALGNPASMNLDGEITIEAWINVESTDGIRNIVAHGYTPYPQAEVFFRIQDGRYEVGSWDGVSHKTVYDIPAEDIGEWVYLVGVYDGAAWRLYRNGVEASSTADGTGAVLVNGSWALGARGTGDERFFHGFIDEVAVHSRVLSDQEILGRYYKGGIVTRVVPIDWTRFDQAMPQDEDFNQSVAILLNSARYNTAWIEQTFDENPERGMYVLTDTTEQGVRPAASAVYGLAAVLRTGIFDQDIIGASEGQVISRTVKLIKGVAAIHQVNGTPGASWGNSWQSALWAAMLGQAGWMLWEDLDVETQHWLASAIEYEANRFIEPSYQVPYWNGVGGDSKAEENAWNALLLHVAIAMMPDAPQALQWKQICSELMISAFALEEDMQNDTLSLDGQFVQEWLNGYNLRADGVVINHDLVHNDYMSTITFNMHAILSQSLAGRPVPEATDFNFDVVYQSLVTNTFPSPPYEEPGGTMYIPGAPEQYYPQGTDWSHYRFDIFYVMDVYAHIFEYDSGLPYTAQHWMRLRAQKILEMQSRHTDGHIYAPGEYDIYPGCEQLAIWQMADAFLLHWLYWQDSISETANWLAVDSTR